MEELDEVRRRIWLKRFECSLGDQSVHLGECPRAGTLRVRDVLEIAAVGDQWDTCVACGTAPTIIEHQLHDALLLARHLRRMDGARDLADLGNRVEEALSGVIGCWSPQFRSIAALMRDMGMKRLDKTAKTLPRGRLVGRKARTHVLKTDDIELRGALLGLVYLGRVCADGWIVDANERALAQAAGAGVHIGKADGLTFETIETAMTLWEPLGQLDWDQAVALSERM